MELFDDTNFIDKSVITSNTKEKWKKEFQKLCDSDEIRKESEETGLNACGYWFACDLCEDSGAKYPCAKSLIEYMKNKGIQIDYKNTSHKYLDSMLRYEEEQ